MAVSYMNERGSHVLDGRELRYWIEVLDSYTDGELHDIERDSAASTVDARDYGLDALHVLAERRRVELARIVRAVDVNLEPRRTVDRHAPPAGELAYDIGAFISAEEGRRYRVSALQAAIAMQILGYRAQGRPRRYNVTLQSYHAMLRAIGKLREMRRR